MAAPLWSVLPTSGSPGQPLSPVEDPRLSGRVYPAVPSSPAGRPSPERRRERPHESVPDFPRGHRDRDSRLRVAFRPSPPRDEKPPVRASCSRPEPPAPIPKGRVLAPIPWSGGAVRVGLVHHGRPPASPPCPRSPVARSRAPFPVRIGSVGRGSIRLDLGWFRLGRRLDLGWFRLDRLEFRCRLLRCCCIGRLGDWRLGRRRRRTGWLRIRRIGRGRRAGGC